MGQNSANFTVRLDFKAEKQDDHYVWLGVIRVVFIGAFAMIGLILLIIYNHEPKNALKPKDNQNDDQPISKRELTYYRVSINPGDLDIILENPLSDSLIQLLDQQNDEDTTPAPMKLLDISK